MSYSNQTKTRDFLLFANHLSLINNLSNDSVLAITLVNRANSHPHVLVTGPKYLASAIMKSNFLQFLDPNESDTLIHLPIIQPISDRQIESLPIEELSALTADIMSLEFYPYVSPYLRDKPSFWPSTIPFKAISQQANRKEKWRHILISHQIFVGRRVTEICGQEYGSQWKEGSGDENEDSEREDVGRAGIMADHVYEKKRSSAPSVIETMANAVELKITSAENTVEGRDCLVFDEFRKAFAELSEETGLSFEQKELSLGEESIMDEGEEKR
ncbi:hypothetical protein PENTCL1PPCAC_1586, partial [Pristionchus entomophagus]